MTAVEAISGDVLRVEQGSLYPALHRMEAAGSIRAAWATKDNGQRARIYELTARGRKQLASEAARWAAVTGAVVCLGLAGGLPGGVACERFVESLLFEVQATNPLKIDPAQTLRSE